MQKRSNTKTKTLLRMKITALLLIATLTMVNAANTYSQTATLTVEAKNQTIQTVLDQIESQSEFHFFYNTKQVDTKRLVSVKAKGKTVFDVLDEVFRDTNITYEVLDKNIILSTGRKEISTSGREAPGIRQQSGKRITGVVLDQDSEPVIGANVVEKGTTNGVVTGLDGEFALNVSENATIQVSFIGYNAQEIVVGSTTEFTIQLQESSLEISEVVVTALGIKRSEKALGYSVQKIDSEELTNVKGTNIATSLSGKIAGVTVLNKNAFDTAPEVLLRGERPLIVIDGVPFENTGLSQVAADDIESMSVLKGATASALYGSKGASGAIMITTKRGTKEGLSVSVNSNTMFKAGYLVRPEVQSSYSSGSGGKYLQEMSEYIWGDKLDIGRTAVQYDPYTYEWREMPLVSKGKDNFNNLLETSFVTNNNVSVAYKGQNGSFRTSLTHVYNKGQFPGNKLNNFTYTVAGDMKFGKFSLDASISYNGSYSPQFRGEGYGWDGYLYNMVVWTGTEFDIRDFKNYWKEGKEDIEQNWHYKYDYNNPYFLAKAATKTNMQNRANAQATLNYEITDWVKATARVGSDTYSKKEEYTVPLSARNSQTGSFEKRNYRGYSITGDALLIADKKLGDFNVGGIFGAGLTYYQDDYFRGYTNGGLTVPGFYSLQASKDLPSVSTTVKSKQTNSLYGKVEVSWRSAIFLEATGRNDWVSTLDKSENSYFYPSVSGSVILSELVDISQWVSFLKIRSSWTMTKTPADIYDINKAYTIKQNVWDSKSTASYPTMMRDAMLVPQQSTSFEAGAAVHFLNNRLRFDVAYYTKLFTDIQREAPISHASGFEKTLINFDEERIKKGWEVTITGDVIKTKDLNWTATVNWGRDRIYYHKVDETYSTDKPWVKKGARYDWFNFSSYNGIYDWERDPQGNIVHSGGMPVLSNYSKKIGHSRADWVWGFNNHLNYKQFSLNFSFDGRVGGKGYNRMEQAMWNSGTHPDSDNEWRYDEVVNGNTSYVGQGVKVVSGSVKYDSYGNILEDTRKFESNDVAVSYEAYTKTYHPWNGGARIQNVHDLTYFKLREISLGYKLPKSILDKAGIDNLQVSVVGQNLLIWTKDFKFSDPDAIYEDYDTTSHAELLNAPSMRYVGLNIKLDF
ncbi:MAG: SusC/RagA family TonB-linked outer membrane protein [Tannerella sp.]|jgi:TonB-linked SusC/RagA family outer membrane protein|nr:SusC/RagA family TonB-linked outer membrane protein [Tannerella sp.]